MENLAVEVPASTDLGARNRRHLPLHVYSIWARSSALWSWRRYAERFLGAEQIDEPDVDAVLSIKPKAAA